MTAEGQALHLIFYFFLVGQTPTGTCHVQYLQPLIASIRHNAFNVHKKIWDPLFLSMSAVLCLSVCVCAMFRAVLIFQGGEVRLSFLPVYIMFVILIYRWTKAASTGKLTSGPVSPAGLVGVILILQSCNMPANEPHNGSRTTWVLEPVGPILVAAHHQLYLLLLYSTCVLFTVAKPQMYNGTQQMSVT